MNRTNYLEYLNRLRRLWGSYTRRNGSWAQIITKEIRVLSLKCKDTEGDNDMRSFIRLHTWIEQSMLMDEIATDFVVFSLRKQAPAIPFQTWCARNSLGRSGFRNQYYVHERAMQTALSHNLFDVTMILPRIYLEECVSYIIFSFRIPGNSTEEMETAFEELERALVRYKTSKTLQIHLQIPPA